MIDRGNADLRSIEQDFRRIGVRGIRAQLASHNKRWIKTATYGGDQATTKISSSFGMLLLTATSGRWMVYARGGYSTG